MELEELLTLIDRMDQSKLAYLQVIGDQSELTLAKEMPTLAPQKLGHESLSQVSEPSDPMEGEELPVKPEELEEEGHWVKAPMVGVAYLQEEPGAPAFVQVGDQVQAGQTLLIIEAMKLMNQIQAPVSGRVVDIQVSNEEVVEFDQALICIQE